MGTSAQRAFAFFMSRMFFLFSIGARSRVEFNFDFPHCNCKYNCRPHSMAPPMSDSAPLLRLLCVAAAVVAVAEGAQPPKKNVLFFVSDDFRPDTGAYGNPFASTPNLDKLAEEGLLFRAAHVQFAYCAPSRNSFMSGQVLLSPLECMHVVWGK